MRELINKVTEYRDILSEGKLSYVELYGRRMDNGICHWMSQIGDYNEYNAVSSVLNRIEFNGSYICTTPTVFDPYPKKQEKRIKALNFIIKELEKMDKPWYWKIFLRKGYLDLTK